MISPVQNWNFQRSGGGGSKKFLILNNLSGDGKFEGGRVCGYFLELHIAKIIG